MAKKKWLASFLGLASAVCLGVGFVSLPTDVETANAEGKTIIADFSSNTDPTVTKFMVGIHDRSQNLDTTLAMFTGEDTTYHTWYPDWTFLTYKTGVDTTTNVGEANGTYLKVGLIPQYASMTTETTFSFTGVESGKIGKLIVRAYIQLNATETSNTTITFKSLDGTGSFVYNTYGNEGKWVDIEIAGSNLKNVVNTDTFSGFTMSVVNAQGSGCYVDFKNSWHDFKAAPCYVMLDSVSYESEAAATYNVTYNYGGKLENTTQEVNANPYKATKPADPLVAGYDFGGWFTDEACTTAYDFDTVLTEDITLYAKWTEVVMADGILTDFSGSDASLSDLTIGTHSVPVDQNNEMFSGVGFETYYPEKTFLTYKKGIDSLTDVGEEGKNYLKVGMLPYFAGGYLEFKVTFNNGIEAEKLGAVSFRMYINLNSSAATKITISSLDGQGTYVYKTEGKDGQWVDVEISGTELAKIANAETFAGFGFKIENAGGSGFYQELKNSWHQCEKEPCYVMLDNVSYVEKTAEYTVTFDYGDKAENATQVLTAAPFKATAPTDPFVSGYKIEGWYADAEFTTEYDFDTVVTEDITLYAKWVEVIVSGGIIADMTNTSVVLGTADIERESYTDWANYNVGFGGTFPEFGTFWETNVEGSEDGNALRVNAIGFNLTPAVGFGITFLAPLTVADIGSITLRMYMHLDKVGDSVFRVYADNEEHFDFTTETQDEWVDIVITRDDLDRIVSGEKLSKLSFILTFGSIYLGSIKPGYSAYWDVQYEAEPAWAWIDTISYAELAKVSFVDGETTTVVNAAKGATVEAPNPIVPEGKVFLGWYNGEDLFDLNEPIEGTITLTAKYGDEIADYSTVAGVYTANGMKVILNADKSMFIIAGDNVTECTYAAAATGAMVATYQGQSEYFTYADGKIDLGGNMELTKVAVTVKVTYKMADGERVVLCASGDIPLNVVYVKKGYDMKGWFADGATEAYSFDTPITADLTLTAKLEMVEIESYDDYLGTYYNATSGAMIVLAAENKATIVIGGETKEASYWLLADSVGVYAIDGVETEFKYDAAKVVLNNAELKVLKNYSVAFKADGKTLSVIYVNSGLYRATKPEDPVKNGYNFVGWFESGAKESFNFDSVITKNTILTAKFEKKVAEKKESGCGSSIGGLAIVATTLIGAAAVVLRKKED